MSKPDIYVPIFIGDYLADTARFNTQDHGAYFLLIMDYWRCGPPPDDREMLLGITKLRGKGALVCLLKVLTKFTLVEGFWHHKRIDEELARSAEILANASEKGRKAAAARWGKQPEDQIRSDATGIAQALPEQSSLPLPLPIKDPKERESTSTYGAELSLSENFDGRVFDVSTFDESKGRCALKRFPFVWLSQAELNDAKKTWREANGISQDEWVLGMRRLNAYCEGRKSAKDFKCGLAFKQLTGFILTEALEQRRKKPTTNGHAVKGKAYQSVKRPERNGVPEVIGNVLRRAQTEKPEGEKHG